MRKHGVLNAYERCKEFIDANPDCNRDDLHIFILLQKELPDEEKQRLLLLKPSTYLGVSESITSSSKSTSHV